MSVILSPFASRRRKSCSAGVSPRCGVGILPARGSETLLPRRARRRRYRFGLESVAGQQPGEFALLRISSKLPILIRFQVKRQDLAPQGFEFLRVRRNLHPGLDGGVARAHRPAGAQPTRWSVSFNSATKSTGFASPANHIGRVLRILGGCSFGSDWRKRSKSPNSRSSIALASARSASETRPPRAMK